MRIYIEEVKPARYRVRSLTPDGAVLIKSSRQPLLDACRALIEMGITGRVEMWDAVRPYARMSADIEKGAKLMCREDRGKLELVRYVPRPVTWERRPEPSADLG